MDGHGDGDGDDPNAQQQWVQPADPIVPANAKVMVFPNDYPCKVAYAISADNVRIFGIWITCQMI